MSIRSDASGDHLVATLSTLTIGTGAHSFGIWVKLISDRNANGNIFGAADDYASPTTYPCVMSLDADGTGAFAWTTTNSTDVNQIPSVGTWYWVVISRNGTSNIRCRIFDDSTSTTPVADQANNTDSTNYTTIDTAVVGEIFSGEWIDAEVVNAKIHTGVEWTNAQCRTESQNFGIQTAGGTNKLCWKLTDTSASTAGLYEIGGSGPNFTNSGMSNGASNPTQLSAGTTLTPSGSEATAQSGTPTVLSVFNAWTSLRLKWA